MLAVDDPHFSSLFIGEAYDTSQPYKSIISSTLFLDNLRKCI